MKHTKKSRTSEYKKVQEELGLLAGQSGGWTKIDERLNTVETTNRLTANDVKSLRDWIGREKETRKGALKTELSTINEFFKQYKEHPTSLRQTCLHKKGLPIGAPSYDSFLEASECQLEECNIKLEFGLKPSNCPFAFMNDEMNLVLNH